MRLTNGFALSLSVAHDESRPLRRHDVTPKVASGRPDPRSIFDRAQVPVIIALIIGVVSSPLSAKEYRSREVTREFQREHPCPSTEERAALVPVTEKITSCLLPAADRTRCKTCNGRPSLRRKLKIVGNSGCVGISGRTIPQTRLDEIRTRPADDARRCGGCPCSVYRLVPQMPISG